MNQNGLIYVILSEMRLKKFLILSITFPYFYLNFGPLSASVSYKIKLVCLISPERESVIEWLQAYHINKQANINLKVQSLWEAFIHYIYPFSVDCL